MSDGRHELGHHSIHSATGSEVVIGPAHPCEYAERARTRAQIICTRTSGRRAVGIAPYRRDLCLCATQR